MLRGLREHKKPRVEAHTERAVWWNLVSLRAVLNRDPLALIALFCCYSKRSDVLKKEHYFTSVDSITHLIT